MEEMSTKLTTVTLTNAYGMFVEIINFGARIKSIKFPINSKLVEMTLGYASAQEYLTDELYLGATCGRVCNRIAGGKFELDGRQYQLTKNDGENCLHGGYDNFSLRYWQIDIEKLTESSVTLSLFSQDGDQGFPGNLTLSVTYRLDAENKLTIEYSANTDITTAVNLTNHTYFNLGEQDCQSLYLQICASVFLESDASNIPTGNVNSVGGNDYDFREPANIGLRQMKTLDKSLQLKKGYDHCYILDNMPFDEPKAILTSLQNQICLTVYTDQPAIQFYTGCHLSGQFKPYQGLCLEAQNYTDADNHSHFPSNSLQSNQHYQRKIILAFASIR